ncbi:hypothetical protein ASPCAL09528 [Aspergillus calidoustus]|uniref:Mediator complex subunit 15 KIX domain-containing protein n=1 Tax=Aspergillus calidoustus TaxID=454130 RepID=A0A0U5GVS1_ASPCI|nr:hypothetical protein ASPCAL09528 [Aspergillus calidoustus]
MPAPPTHPPRASIRTTSASKAQFPLLHQTPSFLIKRTIVEDCTRDADSGRPPKYHCLRKEVERREKRRLLDVLKRAPVSSLMPGRLKRQTGRVKLSQQAAIQQQQQQQEETQPEGAIKLDDGGLSSLSPAEYENVCRVATVISNNVPQNDMDKIILNLRNRSPRQKNYLHKKGMDPVTYFFRCQALEYLQRRSSRPPNDTHSSGEARPRDTKRQNDDLSGSAPPQFFMRPSSSGPDENAPHDDLMDTSVPVMGVGNAGAHKVNEVAEDSETHRRQAHGPRNGNMPYLFANIEESLQEQGPFRGWRTQVTVRDRTYKVHQMIASLRLLQPKIQLRNAANAAMSFEAKVFRGAASKAEYDREFNDKLVQIRDARIQEQALEYLHAASAR